MRSLSGKNSFLIALTLCFSAAFCRAEEPFATLSISPATVQPGANVPLEVVLLNPATDPVSFATPAEMAGTLIVGERRWPVMLRQQQGDPREIKPGAFSRRSYVVHLPEDAYGLGVLEIEAPLPLRGAIDIAKPPRPAIVAVEPAPPPPPPPAPPPPPVVASNETPPPTGSAEHPAKRGRDRDGLIPRSAASRVERAFRDHFSAHEPVYFIYGGKTPEAKFQLSFKYRVVGDNEEGDGDRTKNSVQFGYSQRSLWAINQSSSPFYDTSYMPEFFYEYLTPESPGEPGHFTFLGFQTGYGHESNGRDLANSRSLNTLFFRPAVALGRLDGWRVILAPRVFGYVFDLSDNPDIKKYRGYGEMRVMIGKNEGPELALTGRTGSGWDYTTYQADLTVPLRFKFSNFASYFLMQYFDGYGESLITYRGKSSVLRAGFSFVR